MFPGCQCIDFGSRLLVSENGRSRGRGKYLECYEIFVQEKSRWLWNLKLHQSCSSGMLCCISEFYNVGTLCIPKASKTMGNFAEFSSGYIYISIQRYLYKAAHGLIFYPKELERA